MMQKCQDGYYVTFSSLLSLEDYNKEQEAHTRWTRCPVNALKVNALDKASPLYVNTSAFASEVTSDAIEDTTENLGLAMEVDGKNYPIRDTAYKSLLDRAKISGNSLAKLERKVLAKVLNSCYKRQTLYCLSVMKRCRQYIPVMRRIIRYCRFPNFWMHSKQSWTHVSPATTL